MGTDDHCINSDDKNFLSSLIDALHHKEPGMSFLELAALESSILDAVPQAIVGLHKRVIIFANNAVKDTFGWHREELIGKSVSLFYRNEKESDEIARYFYSTLARQRTFVNEFYCRRKDGKDILCRMRAARIGETLVEQRIVITYEDITEKRHAEEELERSREQLRNLSMHLQSVREKESARIAREIHDELGQSLTALQMGISWLGSQLSENLTALKEKTDRMARLVDTTIESVHRIMAELRPTVLDDLGLTAAVEWLTEDFTSRSGIRCETYVDCRDSSIGRELATTLFRIIQETLTNVARHANATMAWIRLTQDTHEIYLEIADNGKGITRAQIENSRSFGIIGIRERVHLLNGSVMIAGKYRRGTTLKAHIPMFTGEA